MFASPPIHPWHCLILPCTTGLLWSACSVTPFLYSAPPTMDTIFVAETSGRLGTGSFGGSRGFSCAWSGMVKIACQEKASCSTRLIGQGFQMTYLEAAKNKASHLPLGGSPPQPNFRLPWSSYSYSGTQLTVRSTQVQPDSPRYRLQDGRLRYHTQGWQRPRSHRANDITFRVHPPPY